MPLYWPIERYEEAADKLLAIADWFKVLNDLLYTTDLELDVWPEYFEGLIERW